MTAQADQARFVLEGLSPNTRYVVRVRTRCGSINSSWSPNFNFTTGSAPRLGDEGFAIAQMNVYPNPTNGPLTLNLSANTSTSVYLRVLDLAGRVIMQQNLAITEGDNRLPLDLTGNAPGLYIVEAKTETQQLNARIIVR
jgi:hypothetical protein